VGKPEGRRPLGRPRRRWVDNIKMDLREIGWWYWLDWSGSELGSVEGSCEHGNEPTGSIKCWDVLEWLHNWQLLKKGPAPWVSEWVCEWCGEFIWQRKEEKNTINSPSIYSGLNEIRAQIFHGVIPCITKPRMLYICLLTFSFQNTHESQMAQAPRSDSWRSKGSP
jgi:hypothetical protein